MQIFEFTDCRAYLRHYIERLPKNGRGELTRIASHLAINTTLLSQIMSGARSFTPEQAFELSRYLGHSEPETDYFALMVQHDRAATAALQGRLKQKMLALKSEALQLAKRIGHERELSEAERSQFYSSWLYSAIHLFTSTQKKGVHLGDICERFDLTKAKANQILKFLMRAGLVIEAGDRYKMGVQSTLVERGSVDQIKHHNNWRLHSILRGEEMRDDEMMFTGQVSLSRADFEVLRRRLEEFIVSAIETVKDSPPEDIACLNIDWYWI